MTTTIDTTLAGGWYRITVDHDGGGPLVTVRVYTPKHDAAPIARHCFNGHDTAPRNPEWQLLAEMRLSAGPASDIDLLTRILGHFAA